MRSLRVRAAAVLVLLLLSLAPALGSGYSIIVGAEDLVFDPQDNIIYVFINESDYVHVVEDLIVDGDLTITVMSMGPYSNITLLARNLTVQGTLRVEYESLAFAGVEVYFSTDEGSYTSEESFFLQFTLVDSKVQGLLVLGKTMVNISNSTISVLKAFGFREAYIAGSRVGSLMMMDANRMYSIPVAGEFKPAKGSTVVIEDSTLFCPSTGEGPPNYILFDDAVAPNLLVIDGSRLGCDVEAVQGFSVDLYGNAVIEGVTVDLAALVLTILNVEESLVVNQSSLTPTITVSASGENATMIIEYSELRLTTLPINATGNVTGNFSQVRLRPTTITTSIDITNSSLIISNSVLEVDLLRGVLGDLRVDRGILSIGDARVRVTGNIIITNTTLSLLRSTIETYTGNGDQTQLVLRDTVILSDSPLRIVALGNLAVEVVGCQFRGAGTGISVRLENTTAILNISSTSVLSPNATFLVYALPPSTGHGVIITSKSFYAGALGPEVRLNGTLVKRGAAVLAVSGIPGIVNVENWLPYPGGPLIRADTSPAPVQLEAGVPGRVYRVEASTGAGWTRALLVVFSQPVRSTWLSVGEGYEIVGVLAPGGEANVVEASPGNYTVSAPVYTAVLVVLIEQTGTPAVAEDTSTFTESIMMETPSAGETMVEDGGGREVPLDLALLALSMILAVLLGVYVYMVRGRK